MEALGQAGMWCRDNGVACSSIWWCGPGNYLVMTLAGVAAWSASFLLICGLLYPPLRASIERWPSKYETERGPGWFAVHVQSTIHASMVVYMVCGPVATLALSPLSTQFETPSRGAGAVEHSAAGRIGNASHVFFCYTLVDTLVTFYRREMTLDYFLHHCVCCFFCILLQYHCFGPYLAGWLILMEISTVFLNGFSFFRNRLGYDHILVKGFFLCFAFTFMACRLVGSTHIAGYFGHAVYVDGLPFAGIPRWHLHLLSIALAAVVILQFVWAYSIGKKVVKVFVGTREHNGKAEEQKKR